MCHLQFKKYNVYADFAEIVQLLILLHPLTSILYMNKYYGFYDYYLINISGAVSQKNTTNILFITI